MSDLASLGQVLLRPEELLQLGSLLREALQHTSLPKATLISLIPRPDVPSYAPLYTLSILLDRLPTGWPTLLLQQVYTQFWKILPEEAKSGRACASGRLLLDKVLVQCKTSYGSLLELLPSQSHDTALIDPHSGQTISHAQLSASLKQFSLPLPVVSRQHRPVVAISLPNGALLAMTVLAVATYYVAAPLAHGNGVGPEQFKTDVLQSKTNVVLASPADVQRLGLHDQWLADAGIQVFLAFFSHDMELTISTLDGRPPFQTLPPQLNGPDDVCILLFTSGTSGTKKLVPLHVHSLVCGVAMVVDSWGLDSSMRCLNQMPLNHVGGLVRNLFAPLISGGSIIACSAFDPGLFWDCVEDWAPTWYYASPTMHQGYLQVGQDRPESVAKSNIRLVCNAAGGLLPSLAIQIRETFSNSHQDCVVLPSYGMTECMPISTPPLAYKLDRTGTSGISIGPEICILDGNDDPMEAGMTGRISVRGAPVFSGYLQTNNVVDTSCFTRDGRFDTGDMGYLDSDGYLFITGRSKEVINRGGELISPFEVEEAVMTAAAKHGSAIEGRVERALAFSVPHEVLQEVVGIAVVTPPGSRRTCLRDIQESLKSLLGSVKVPQLVVFIDALPVNNNKVLRIKLAERLGLPEISDNTSQAHRHLEAVCPPPNTPLSVPIVSRKVEPYYDGLEIACRQLVCWDVEVHIMQDVTGFYPEVLLAPKQSISAVPEVASQTLLARLGEMLDAYNVPEKVLQIGEPFPRTISGAVDEAALEQLIHPKKAFAPAEVQSETIRTIIAIFASVLNTPTENLSSESDFFDLGGDSLRAGRLLSLLRKEFQIRLSIDILFTNRTIRGLADLIDDRLEHTKVSTFTGTDTQTQQSGLLPGCDKTCSSTNPALLLLQLLPLAIIFPMKRALTWTIFVHAMSYTLQLSTNESVPGRLLNLVISLAIAKLFTRIISPLVAIAFKWLVVGRYREGVYPMWSSYHTRWWITEKVISIAGLGIFGMFDTTRVLYFRLMGARIGRNVTLAKGVQLGEYDLLTIGDDAVLERCTVRPFAAERNTSMYLGRISIGAGASVGLASIVAAGTSVPPMACIGPNSSSWELQSANEANRDLAASKIPKAHWALSLFAGVPIMIIIMFVGALPWLLGLIALVSHEPSVSNDMLHSVLVWFASPNRVAWHYLALAANFSLGPVFFFIAVLAVKKSFDAACGGPITPTKASSRSNLTTFRSQLVRTLLPATRLHNVSALFGGHYETTSILYRLMGAKVGKRVYWPGTGPSVQDYDLLEVGNDVVFGSRSHLVTSDGSSSDYVRIEDGAMIADRVTLLPGVQIGKQTVMGSGALTRRNQNYPSSTTWVGSKDNDAICLTQPLISEKTYVIDSVLEQPLPLRAEPGYSSYATTLNPSGMNSEVSSICEKGKGLVYKEREIEEAVEVNAKRASISIGGGNTSSPFGRAFYEGKAPYFVLGQFSVSCYSIFITIVTAVYWNISSISALQVINRISNTSSNVLVWHSARPLMIYGLFTAFIAAIMAVQAIFAIAVIIGAKWALLGRRQAGNYDWDKSSYCQRWQLFLKIEQLRRHCYGSNGILGLLTGTWWIAQYFRALGANIGKDCALFVSGTPSLYFTEPDLLTLGERVTVDDASLVGHINTRGKFDLNLLHVGAHSVLRTGSRLLSGARMEENACLLEHTLVMAGDVVDAGCTSQGWPAEEFKGSRMPTLKLASVWTVA